MSDPTLPQLLQWFDLCALQNCDSATQTSLSEWGGPIFLNQVRRVYPRSELLKLSRFEAWCAFEAICHEKAKGEGATGIAWKKHLLRCAQAGGMEEDAQRVILLKMLCIRLQWEATAIASKERRLREGSGGVTIMALDEPVSDDKDSPTFGQLYGGADHDSPDPATEAEETELDQIARAEAIEWFNDKMTSREKLALGCKHAGRPLTDKVVLAEADVGKSVFFDCLLNFVRRFAESLQEKYVRIDPQTDLRTVREFVTRALRELGRLCEAVLPPEDLQGAELGKVEQATSVPQPENPRDGSL